MSTVRWQLEEQKATLLSATIEASIDLAHPERGLSLQLPKRDPALKLSVLGFVLGERETQRPEIDAYVRENDLIATFERAGPRPMRAQVYWRWLEASELTPELAAHVLLAFDVIASVNTSLLDANPSSTVCSLIESVEELLNLSKSDQDGLHAVHVGPATDRRDDAVKTIGPTHPNTGCFVTRLGTGELSWVEMVHPTDFRGSTATLSESGSLPGRGSIRLVHELFQQRLEKGVILRARVRGALVEQSRGADVAIEAYQRFSVGEPPLTV